MIGKCAVHGREVPASRLGELRDSSAMVSDGEVLRRRLGEDGYLFLRGALDLQAVMAARQEALDRLLQVGEIRPPAIEGVATGGSRRRELAGDLGAFWKSVSEGPRLRQLSHGPSLGSLLGTLFREPARGHDYLFLRVGVPGRSTNLHYDYPFFARGSQRIVTVWFPVGDVPAELGPLVVVEGSTTFTDLIGDSQGVDYHSNASPRVSLKDDAITLAERRGVRLLTADFRAGDVVIFGMTTLHGSLDNHSAEGRVRVSADVRYQPASDPLDERYFGPNPGGTTGAGYGELNGAKPLNEPWHVR
ncbi:MAG: phytanoyl-CoA dioxygenase family protein [Planctomycetes bacterium]|nr:phytanoyl-CoA dioxygenase family protein [Planctomycetota bacterium]